MNSTYFYVAAVVIVGLIAAYIFFWVVEFRKYPHQATNRVCIASLVAGILGHLVPRPQGEGSAYIDVFGIRSTEPIALRFLALDDVVVLLLFALIALVAIVCLLKLPATQ